MQSLKVLNEITLNLTQITDLDDLVYQSIRLGIDRLGFTRLSIWFLEDNRMLAGKHRVDDTGKIINNSHEKILLTPNHPAYEVVIATKKRSVIHSSPLFDVEMKEIGHGDKAFVPMLDGENVVGCLYSDTLLDHKPFIGEQIEILNLYGATLGVLFNRQLSRQALEIRETEALRFQEQLKQLNQVTVKLSAITNFSDLTYQVVEQGLETLGFERMGIWFTDNDDENKRHGMWGTDHHGNIIDERHLVTQIPENERHMVTEGDVVMHKDNDLCEADGTFIRKGFTLIGLMWDGTKRLGWLYADNALTGDPISQQQLEIFRLYAATISALCSKRIIEDKLRESEIRYRAITETSSDVVIIIDDNAIMTYVSPSVKYVMDIDPHHVAGQSVWDMIHPEDLPLAEEMIQKCFEQRNLRTRIDDIRIWHVGGYWVHMEAVVTSLFDNAAVNGIVVSCRDITQRRIADERKRLAEQERERSWLLRQFLDDVSHDFRTPLSTIGTYAYLLLNGSTEQIEERVEIIHSQITRITQLIDNMHTIAKLDETSDLAMIPTYINSLLETALTNSQLKIEQKKLTVQQTLHPTLPPILGNPRLLHDAFIHLITNAIQYCDEGDSILLTSQFEDDRLVVTISDTGAGISEEDLPHIFDSLYRADKARNTANGGGGLGLAITRRIIELHNGDIQITSNPGDGTSITLTFPPDQIIKST